VIFLELVKILEPRPDSSRSCISSLWSAILLFGQVVLHLCQGRIYRRLILEQIFKAGPLSIAPVLLVNVFAGMIFTIQTARELAKFGAAADVGGPFALAFCRELAPILTASILAGQVGSAFTAEIGAMKISEQIDALYVLKTDPIDYLVIPRVIGCCLMVPVLTVFSLVIGVLGGMFAAAQLYRVDPETFLASIQKILSLSDLLVIVLKGFVFGIIVAVNSCSWGLNVTGGVRGVGNATTAAVVTTWIAIFMVDLVISLALFENPLL
jgi:phospholipid/cholesterol/gamma-HCH transport system permease protein